MKKPLLLSLVAATLISTNLNAENMYDRIQSMEAQMKSLQKEIEILQVAKASDESQTEDDEESADEEKDDNMVSIEEALSDDDDDEDVEDEGDEAEDEEGDEEEEEDEPIDERVADLEESISDLNKATSGNHLKFSVDYRFGLDNLQYTMADGSEAKNDALLTNRLWINMFFKATDNLSFRGQVAYNKAFGARSGTNPTIADPAYNGYETFDWISNENAYDGTLRVKSAYFFYRNDTFMGTEIPWTFSIGRRPSTNGHLINYRDDDHASSPLAHTINVEFDGLSSKFTLAESWGTSIKVCAGRGLTNADIKFNSTPYATADAIPDIDLVGLIVVPYSSGQFSINTQYYYAANLIDMKDPNAVNRSLGMENVGGLHSFTGNLTIHSFGNGEWGDFLDDTIFFASGAWTKTDPKDDKRMGYAAFDAKGNAQAAGESKTGYSYWIGTQFPSFTEDGRFGLEFNHGSQYFRSITYAEDTNIGSKVAARGNAFEAYMTEYLIEDILSFQVRYTYIDYEYSGSNGFFGGTSGAAYNIADIQTAANAGNPQAIGASAYLVDKAQDIRFYLRYKY